MTADEAISIAVRVVAARYAEADAGFVAGSIVRGEATALSDLDIVILFAALPNAWRESFVFDDVPIDAFVHDPGTLRAFLRKDLEAGKPAMLTMVTEGRVIGPRPHAALPLKDEAETILAKGPPPFDQQRLDQFRYGISSRIDDLRDARPWPQALATGAWLHMALADFILGANGRWGATAKWIPRTLAACDPQVEADFTRAFEAFFERRDAYPLIAFAEQMLAPFGGFLYDGYRAEAPASDRIDRPW